MEEKKYKRNLIIGQEFNRNSGGGIALSNLFKGWSIDKITIVSSEIIAG